MYAQLVGKDLNSRHLKVHKGDRPHLCFLCNKAFSNSSNLTRHMKVHSDDTTHECSTCVERFKDNHNLKRHFRAHMCGSYVDETKCPQDQGTVDTYLPTFRSAPFPSPHSSAAPFMINVRGPPGGYWIPISREKIGHIRKSCENFQIFPIPNFPTRHCIIFGN